MSKLCQFSFIIIGLREQLSKLTYSYDLFPTDLTSSVLYTSQVCNLGIIFHKKNFTFTDHITQLSRTCYMYIRDLRRLRQNTSLQSRVHNSHAHQLLVSSSITATPFSATSIILN